MTTATSFSASCQISKISKHRPEPVGHAREFILLDGPRRVDVLRASLRALTHKRTLPHAVVLGENAHPLRRPFVARVPVIALGERNRRRADKTGLEAVDRT